MRQDLTFQATDGQFHYVDWGGSGPLLHIGHATGFCAGMYTPLADLLTPDFHVFGMDDRGHGLTNAPADPKRLTGWETFAQDYENLWAAYDQPVIAAGHSRAGVASLMAAVRRPDLVKALILIDPTILPFSWMWWWFLAKKFGASGLAPIAYRAARRRNRWADKQEVLDAYQSKGPFPRWSNGFLEGYVEEGFRVRADGQVELCCDPAWESRCFSVCSHEVWSLIPKVKRPCLLLYGEKSDTFLPPAVKRFKKALPHAVVQEFKGTSHFVPMEEPERCRKVIIDFVEKL